MASYDDDENPECEESITEEDSSTIGSMTGGITPPHVIKASAGGFIYPSTTGTVPWVPTTLPSPAWATPATTGMSKSKTELVELPTRMTKKVLIAFLDPDEPDTTKNVVWARVLLPKDVSINVDSYSPEESYMSIDVRLIDFYDNEK